MAPPRSLVALVLSVGLMLALASPAAGRTLLGDLPGEASEVDQHAVAPSVLAYGYDGGFQKPYGIFVQRAGGRPQRLRGFDPLRSLRSRERGADQYTRTVAVGASDRYVAVGVSSVAIFDDGSDEQRYPGPAVVAVSRPDGRRIVRIAQCRAREFPTVRVDGSTVAYLGGGCDPDNIGVRDMRTGASRIIRPPRDSWFYDVKVAGRYVAGALEGGGGGVAVYDWRSGRRIYRAPHASEGFSLASDGAVADVAPRPETGCPYGDARWFSPADPRPHVLPGAGCDDDVLIAPGRILGSRFVDSVPDQGVRSEYFVADLLGRKRTAMFMAQIAPTYARYPVYFDGRRVGYSTPSCDGGERIVVDTVKELARGGPVPGETCRLSLRRVPARVRLVRSSLARLRFPCSTGCSAHVRLWDPAAGEYLALEQGDYMATFSRRGGTATADIQLAPQDAERIARDGRLDLELRVEIFHPSGRSTHRARPLTLLPPA